MTLSQRIFYEAGLPLVILLFTVIGLLHFSSLALHLEQVLNETGLSQSTVVVGRVGAIDSRASIIRFQGLHAWRGVLPVYSLAVPLLGNGMSSFSVGDIAIAFLPFDNQPLISAAEFPAFSVLLYLEVGGWILYLFLVRLFFSLVIGKELPAVFSTVSAGFLGGFFLLPIFYMLLQQTKILNTFFILPLCVLSVAVLMSWLGSLQDFSHRELHSLPALFIIIACGLLFLDPFVLFPLGSTVLFLGDALRRQSDSEKKRGWLYIATGLIIFSIGFLGIVLRIAF